MKQKLLPLLLALSLLLTGCGWMDGRYSSVTPHLEQRQDTQPEVIVASDYLDLMDALEEMIQSGSESGVINVADYPAGRRGKRHGHSGEICHGSLPRGCVCRGPH